MSKGSIVVYESTVYPGVTEDICIAILERESIDMIGDADCVVLAVAHDIFKNLSIDSIDRLFGKFSNQEKVIIDVKSILDKNLLEESGYSYWRL